MNESQAKEMIELLKDISDKLRKIQYSTSDIKSSEKNLDDIYKKLGSIEAEISSVKDAIKESN